MPNIFSQVSRNYSSDKIPLIDYPNVTANIFDNFLTYIKMTTHQFTEKVPFLDILRTKYPLLLPVKNYPVELMVQLSAICNIKCKYCKYQENKENGFMNYKTSKNLIKQINNSDINKVHLTGCGEHTLHPNFGNIIKEFAKSVKYLSIATNAQWKNDKISSYLLNAPVSLIHVSVDGCTKEHYERSRVGASFETLINNLHRLRELRNELKAPTLINIRIMICPSDIKKMKEFIEFWKKYGDTVQKHYIIKKKSDNSNNRYVPAHSWLNKYPRCRSTFHCLSVRWKGDVPLCGDNPKEYIILGNINKDKISDIWNSKILNEIRIGQRFRDYEKLPICRGCKGHC